MIALAVFASNAFGEMAVKNNAYQNSSSAAQVARDKCHLGDDMSACMDFMREIAEKREAETAKSLDTNGPVATGKYSELFEVTVFENLAVELEDRVVRSKSDMLNLIASIAR
jgi:hypothetical protein